MPSRLGPQREASVLETDGQSSESPMTPFNGSGLLCVKDLTEDSEEVGNRKLRPKQRMLAKANHADTRRLGKIAYG